MELSSLFTISFLLGLRHALDPDHVASVATISSSSRTLIDGLKQGVAWGVGHTLTLLLFGGSALLLGLAVPENLASILELMVGVMLVILGLDLIRRIVRGRLHVHEHEHDHGESHIHVHSHGHSDLHEHVHSPRIPIRALIIGLMHGMAGSAALMLLTVASAPTASSGIGYILIFGIGSILGMGALSVLIALPLRISSNCFKRAEAAFQLGIGAITVLLGANIIRTILAGSL